MSEDVFDVVSQVMRYWFVALGLLIVWRTYRCLRQERKARHRRLRSLPGAGMIGEWVVEKGSDELREGMAVPVPREGVLGDRRFCDVYIPVEGVTHCHLFFRFDPKRGLRVTPARRQICFLNGALLTSRSVRKEPALLHHGDVLTVGEAVLRLRVLLGLEKAYRPLFADEAGTGPAASSEACPDPAPQVMPLPSLPDDAPAEKPDRRNGKRGER